MGRYRKLLLAVAQFASGSGSSINNAGVTLGSDDELFGKVPSGVIWASAQSPKQAFAPLTRTELALHQLPAT